MMSKKVTDFFQRKRDVTSGKVASLPMKYSESNFQVSCPSTSQVPDEIFSPDQPFHPPATFCFPKTKICSRERSFQSSWFIKFPWLHYDVRFVEFMFSNFCMFLSIFCLYAYFACRIDLNYFFLSSTHFYNKKPSSEPSIKVS